MNMVEIHSTIDDGSPVLARGMVVGPEPSAGHYCYGIEDLEVFSVNGKPFTPVPDVSDDELDRLSEEMIDHHWEEGQDV